MRIVFVCDTMGAGGAERVISTLSNEFVKRGNNVAIIALSSRSNGSFYKLDKEITLDEAFKTESKQLRFFKKSKHLRRIIESYKPDVVVSFLSYVCIYTWWALRKTNIPFVVSERNDPNQRNTIKQYLLNRSFKKASMCVFQTQEALEYYKKIVQNKSIIIYNPINVSISSNYVPEKNNQILYVGRFNEQKNIFMLIDAFDIFLKTNHNYYLKMYGDGPLKDSIKDYLQAKNLNDAITLMPNSNSWQIDEQKSKLFVLPSKYEGMPNALAEALCLGIPSVSTDCPIGGPSELKKIFPLNLILSNDMTANSFARAMQQGIKLQNSQPRIPKELDTKSIVDKWLEILSKVKC